jgi:primase-polymerase (primpol)-like protein
MRLINPIYDIILKYATDNAELAPDILAIMLEETSVSLHYKTIEKRVLAYKSATMDPKMKRIVKYLNKAIQMDEIIDAMILEDEVDSVADVHKKATKAERKLKEEALNQVSVLVKTLEEERRQKDEERRQRTEAQKALQANLIEMERLKNYIAAMQKGDKYDL